MCITAVFLGLWEIAPLLERPLVIPLILCVPPLNITHRFLQRPFGVGRAGETPLHYSAKGEGRAERDTIGRVQIATWLVRMKKRGYRHVGRQGWFRGLRQRQAWAQGERLEHFVSSLFASLVRRLLDWPSKHTPFRGLD